MSTLSAIASSPMLITYAQGAAQNAVAPVADFLAPTVPVSIPVGRFKKYTQKNRFHVPDTRRAIGGRATEIGFTASDATYNCQPNAIDAPIDIMESAATENLEDMLKESATMAAEVGGLAHEINVVNGAVTALTALGGSQVVTPSWVATNDPIKDLDSYILTVLKAAKYGSLMGVRVLLGATVLSNLKNHSLVRNRFIVGGANMRGPAVAPLAALDAGSIGSLLLGNPETRSSFMVYDSAAEGVAESISFVLDNSIIVFAAKESPTRRDPSFMKTFRLENKWMVPGVYMRDDQRVEVAKFDWSEDIQVTNSAAAILVNPSWS